MFKNKKISAFVTIIGLIFIVFFVLYNPIKLALGLVNGTISELYYPELTAKDINQISVIYVDTNEVITIEYNPDNSNFNEVAEYLSNLEIKSLRNSYKISANNDLKISIFIRFYNSSSHILELHLHDKNIISIGDKTYRIKDGFNIDLLLTENQI